MGFFSKLWKGVKKVVKKIGKGIKKVVGKIGKFVGKLGIVGQIGMFFIMPHVGAWLMKGLGGAASFLTGVAGQGLGSTLARGLGHVLKGAHNFVTVAKNTFSTITEGIGQFAKTALNKIPGVTIDGAATNFFGNDSAWSRTMKKGSTIFDPFKNQITSTGKKTVAELARSAGVSEKQLIDLNPELGNIVEGGKVPEGVFKTFQDTGTMGVERTFSADPSTAVPVVPVSEGTFYDQPSGFDTYPSAEPGTAPKVPVSEGTFYDQPSGFDTYPSTAPATVPKVPVSEGTFYDYPSGFDSIGTPKVPGTVNQSLLSKTVQAVKGRYEDLNILDAAQLLKKDYTAVAGLINPSDDEYEMPEPQGSGPMFGLAGEASIGYSSDFRPSAANVFPGLYGNAAAQRVQNNYALPAGG
tara:strand:+ start:1356 stop:2582 length:1227 start_codon:yes stop_codon:yes gene_type:complete